VRLHILNPSERHRSHVQKNLRVSKPDVAVWIQPEHPYHCETILRWGLQEGFRSFIVWAGDGTLHRVVESLTELGVGSEVTLGVVPVGTCNDLARHLGLRPGVIDEALEGIRRGKSRKIDVGMVSWTRSDGGNVSHPFTNNAGFGRSLRSIKEKWGAVRNVMDFKAHQLEIEVDGATQQGEFLMAVVCNGPFFSGGLRFSDETSCFDGRLDGFFTRDTNRLELLTRLALGRWGRPLMGPNVVCFEGKTIRVKSEDDLWLQADGETLSTEGTRRLQFTIMPQMLRCII